MSQLTDFLPTTRKEMELRGWDEVDVVLFSGDAYVDHPSFGAAVFCVNESSDVLFVLRRIGLVVSVQTFYTDKILLNGVVNALLLDIFNRVIRQRFYCTQMPHAVEVAVGVIIATRGCPCKRADGKDAVYIFFHTLFIR